LARKKEISLESIKRQALKGIASANRLCEILVFKGGNAIALAHGIGNRASKDLDFSMPGDFDDFELAKAELSSSLSCVFGEIRLEVFDFHIERKPENLSEDIEGFWGGYLVTFKLIEMDFTGLASLDKDAKRRHAISVTPLAGKTFCIDISKYEYCTPKERLEVHDFVIYTYSIPMIAAEKLLAICQQMPEYGAVVHRSRPGAPRARDFLDLHTIVSAGYVQMQSRKFEELLREIFRVKRVPLSLLGRVHEFREFHRPDFDFVITTVNSDSVLESFDYYFDFVCNLCNQLKPLWHV